MLLPTYKYNGEQLNKPIEDAPELIHKTAEVLHIHSGNIVDTNGKTAPGSELGETIHFNFENDTYYSNPFTNNSGHTITIKAKDQDGNTISYSKDGGKYNYLQLNYQYLYEITFEDLTLEYYGFNNLETFLARNPTQHGILLLDSKPSYWTFNANGYTAGDNINRGFTQGSYNEEYVPYVDPVKSYVYSKKLNNHIEEYTDALRGDLLTQSDNLLDYSRINWNTNGGHYYLEPGYYIPIDEGDVVVTNNTQGFYEFYKSSFEQMSGNYGFSTPYAPTTAPQNAVWMRVAFSASYINQGDEVMVWKARSESSAAYERPIFHPNSKQLDPRYVNGSIFDYAVPQNLTQGVVKMARFAALRAANERQNAYRFATYNTYVSRGDRGFWLLREMAFDYALDFIGMQECAYPGQQVQSAMYPWQFPYDTGTVTVSGGTNVPVPAVSRFEITNVEVIMLQESRHCMKISMNLPRHKHYPRVPTLSVYNYHGSLGKSNRLIEIQTMLDEIAEDTSDFIIIMGDTNSEVDAQGHRQSWDMWENAGFTAVHHGESPTWPSQESPSHYSSMDNIFVSEHINVLGYDIVPWQNYMLPGDLPLSDHDMVFADLQFDFDAVLKDTWEEPPTVT